MRNRKGGKARSRMRKSKRKGKVASKPVTPELSEKWDPSLSLRRNLKRIGFRRTIQDFEGSTEIEGAVSVDELFKSEKKPPAFRKPTRMEVKVLEKLMAKYGEDYDRMALDIKINTNQETPTQLRKRFDNLKKWKEFKEKTNEEEEN